MIPICDSVRKKLYYIFLPAFYSRCYRVYCSKVLQHQIVLKIKAFWHLDAISNRKWFDRFGATLDNSSAIKILF